MAIADVHETLNGRKFFCSWSGGKDSALSLHRAIQAGGIPAALLTMMTEGGERSRSHGLRLDVLRSQAEALGLPLITRSASWSTYEDVFRETVREFAQQGITAGVFGDIDLDEHREWCVRVCREAGLKAELAGPEGAAGPDDTVEDVRAEAQDDVRAEAQDGVRAVHPLWKMDRMDVVREFLDAGFQAYIVAMKDGVGRDCAGTDGGCNEGADTDGGSNEGADNDAARNRCAGADALRSNLLALLGRPFDLHAVNLMVAHGIDACGEVGEFHTVVTGGPLFRRPLDLQFGEPVLRDGYWFVDAIQSPRAGTGATEVK